MAVHYDNSLIIHGGQDSMDHTREVPMQHCVQLELNDLASVTWVCSSELVQACATDTEPNVRWCGWRWLCGVGG